ncbi:serine/threonine-protein kinase [Streptomyces wuyuanensis]|uniref:Protein kinase domain-containing protein n=1 Tax=Streptomyces wuyuanensis TaxID=1196353 RepID=A0A1H0CKJ4_9ACTN|nr:serine/threonine-protein kinase [Streptomyces wuyuanensis]SDN58383.1 Protein kinase domain-containing protein [Streptomyces wuyuanensis]
MQPLEAGEPRTIGAYRLLGRLGAGGMGRVYLARSEGGRTVAVKVVHPHFALDEQFRARFRREVEAARRVGGAWTAPVLDADPDAPVPWVATGFVAGPALGAAVAGHGPLPQHTVRTLGAGLAEALAAVHALGLVHRDVKPSNVLLTLDGPRLIDFGIARATDSTASLTTTGVSVGSPGYMAPEQIVGSGEVTGAADVFSLGAVLAYAATGTAPFPGDSSAALLYKVVHEEPELGALTGELRELVGGCLAKDPSARPAPAVLARRLAPAGAGASVAAGWLPGPLVEQVSRTAVRLLDLEPASGEDPLASGPVPFTSQALGVFGPPIDPVPATPPPMPTPPPRQAAAPADRKRGGRLSLSVTTRDESERPGGSRKVSCTVALAVAGVLAAVTVGAGVLLDLFPGGGGGPDDTAAQPPASSETGAPTDGGTGPAEVPKTFAGTWEGSITAAGLPAGTMKVTIEPGGRTGEQVGKAEQTDILGNFICEDLLTATSADARTLVVDARRGPRSKGMCSESTKGLRLELSGGTLRYVSADARAGNPVGDLTRGGR